MSRAKEVAKSLLQTGAVKLNVKEPFTFVSGIKSPIYCDNRKMIGYPVERKVVVDEFVKKLSEKRFRCSSWYCYCWYPLGCIYSLGNE